MDKVWYMCFECGLWTPLEPPKSGSIMFETPVPCGHCGGWRFDYQSATSDRTFDHIRARAKTSKALSNNKKRAK